jgi:hypothetical protein
MTRALITLMVCGLCAHSADVRLRAGDALVVTGWGTSSPVTVTFSSNHGLAVGDLISCHSIQGQQNLNSNIVPGKWQLRKVKTVVSPTEVALTDEAGADIQPIPGAAGYDLLTKVAGPQLGWCGKVQTFQTAPFPRGYVPQSGPARARIENNATSNATIWSSLKARFVDSYTSSSCDGVSPSLCTAEEAKIAAAPMTYVNPGLGQGEPLLALALGWLKTGNQQYLKSARYYLNNVHRFLHMASFAGCYTGLNFCGNGQTNDWGNLALQRFAAAYSVVRDQLPVAERQAFANKIMNNFGDGCTNQMTEKLGELNAAAAGATTLTGSGLGDYQVGDYVIVAYDLSTLRGGRGDITGITVAGGVATVNVVSAHRFKANRLIRVTGTGSALDSDTPVAITAVSGNSFTFATTAADGAYSHAGAVITQFVYNGNEALGRHKVTAVGSNSVTVSPGLSYAQVGAEHRRLPRWQAGNCGFIWYLEGHSYYPATTTNRWSYMKLAEAVTPATTTIKVTPDTWANAPAGTGWYITMGHSNGVTNEVMKVTGRDDGAKTLAVIRGAFSTATLSKSAGASVYVRVSQPFGNMNASPPYVNDWSSNHSWTRLSPAFNVGIALADDDPRAKALAESAWAYARDLMIPFLERHWTGLPPAGGNEGYSFGRYAEMMARMELTLRNSFTSTPYSMVSMLGLLPSWVMHWSMGADWKYMHFFSDYGDSSDLGANLWTWLPVAHHFQPTTETANGIFYWKTLMNGASSWGQVPDIAFAWLIYLDENESGTDFRSTRPPWHFARNTVSANGSRPYSYLDTRTNWTANSTQMVALYPTDSLEHLGAHQTYGNYRIYKKALLTGPIDGLGGGVSNSKQPGIVLITPFRGGNMYETGTRVKDDMRYGSGTARFVRLDCLDCYWKPGDPGAPSATVPVTRHLRYMVHLPSGGQDYAVIYDDWAATAPIANGLLLPYWIRDALSTVFVQSPFPAFTRTGGDIQFRSMKYDVSLLSRVLLPADSAAVTDNWTDVSGSPSSHYAVQVRVTPPNATSGEFLVVHRAIDGTTGSLPSTVLLSAGASYRAVQINDPAEPKVAVFPVGGTNNNPTFTSTHAGSGRYLAAGLEPGVYKVKRNGSDYLTGLSAGDEVGAIEFTGSSGSYELVRTGPPPSITIATNSLPNGTVGSAYSQTLTATGGAPPYTWAVVNGALCNGLTLSSGGVISGTPTVAEVCSFTVRATDSASATATKTLGITVDAVPSPLTITTSSPLPQGTVDIAYSTALQASGGTPPYTWARTAGSLPAGLYLSSTTGVISGTPTAAGVSTFTIQVTDSTSATATKDFSLEIIGSNPALTITTSSLPDAQVGSAYSYTLSATGGSPPYTWNAESGFPAWLTLSAGGVLSGTPSTEGTHNLTVRVTDSASAVAVKTLTLTVDPLPPPALEITTPAALPSGAVSQPYNMDLQATGGTPPYVWTVGSSSTLPPGLMLSASGALSGTPTQSGAFAFTIEVSDSASPAQTASRAFTLFISALPVVSVQVNPVGTNVVVRYGNPGLRQQESCRVVVKVGAATFHDEMDGGGYARRFAYVAGLPESASGTASVTCGQSQGGAEFITKQKLGGQVNLPLRLKAPPGQGITQVRVQYGLSAPDQTIQQPCDNGCTVTLPMLDRDSVYQVTWTWRKANGDQVSSASTMWIVAR